MTDPSNIEGLPPSQRYGEQKTEVEAEKFKRMMKVEESDEAQKRQKRQRPKKEEEEELSQEEKVEEKSPHIAFSDYMEKAKKGENIFDVTGGVKGELVPEEAVSPLKAVFPSSTPPLRTEEERREKEEKEARRAKKIETEAALAKTQEKREKEEINRMELGETPPSVPVPITPTSSMLPSTTQEEKKELSLGGAEGASLPIPVTEPSPPTVPIPLERTEEALIPIKEERLQKKKQEETSPNLPPPIAPLYTTPVERIATPTYASLSSEVFDLFERLVGIMTIQDSKGISTTTVTLNMPGSVFNGSEIVLEHYSTAPGSFNLELRGTPEAVGIFSANIEELAASFQGSRLSFNVNLRPPSLLEEHRPLIRRKEKAGEKKPGE